MEIIFVCALALVAAGNGVLALIISGQVRRVRELESSLATSKRNLFDYGAKWNLELTRQRDKLQELASQSPQKVAARVDELSEDVGRLRSTFQRFQGRFDQKMGRQPVDEPLRTYRAVDNQTDDDEIASLLRLQSAPSAGPR